MKTDREKIAGKVTAETLRLAPGEQHALPDSEETCCFLLVSEGGFVLDYCGKTMLLNPGSAVLLGSGTGSLAPAGSSAAGRHTALYGPVQWASRVRALLEMMSSASGEQDYPGPLYLLLILHYVEQECAAETGDAARPRNETVEQIYAYLSAN